MTTFADQVFQLGGLPVGGFISQGKAIYVKPSSGLDSNDGLTIATAVKTLTRAQAIATANQNDVVFMFAESNTAANTTDYQSVALDWAKDGVHLIGIGSGPMLGQRSRISNLSSATAIVNGLFIVSADNCLIQNIEVFQGQGGTNPTGASIAVLVSGQRNHFVNCQISGIGHSELDDATSRSLKVTGAENLFTHCYIGLDTVIRGTATAEVEVGDIARTIFEKCFFNTYTSLSTFKMVTYSAPDRFILFDDCVLNAVQNITSAVAPTGALAAATSVNGSILLKNSPVYGFADVATADDSKILVYGSDNATLVGLGLAGTVDVA